MTSDSNPACWADPAWLESGGIVDGLVTREDMSACGAGWVPLFKTTEVNQALVAALRYARRMVNKSECDIGFIDAALLKAGSAP